MPEKTESNWKKNKDNKRYKGQIAAAVQCVYFCSKIKFRVRFYRFYNNFANFVFLMHSSARA